MSGRIRFLPFVSFLRLQKKKLAEIFGKKSDPTKHEKNFFEQSWNENERWKSASAQTLKRKVD